MFLDIITVAVFLLGALSVFVAGDFYRRGRSKAESVAEVDRKKSINPFVQALAVIVPQLGSEVDRIERDLRRAGYYGSTALVEYMAARNVLILLVVIVTGILAVLADPATHIPELILVGGSITAVLGYSVPRLVLGAQARARVDRIQKGLPDALDIIRMCLTGGLPLREAIKRVSSEINTFHPDIAVELQVIQRHADANSMPVALRNFAGRIDTPDVNTLAALVSQTDQIGTHVATAVADYADSIRRQHRQRAEEQASKTSIRLLFPVIFCLAPPIYILLCGPPLLKLRNFINDGHRPGGILEPSTYGETITPDGATLPDRLTTGTNAG